MFNLLMSGGGWAPNHDTMPVGRTLEDTEAHIRALYMPTRSWISRRSQRSPLCSRAKRSATTRRLLRA